MATLLPLLFMATLKIAMVWCRSGALSPLNFCCHFRFDFVTILTSVGMRKNITQAQKRQKKSMLSTYADNSSDDDMIQDSEDETSRAVSPKKQKRKNVQSVQKKTPDKVQKQSSLAQKNKSSSAGKNQKAKQAVAAKTKKNTKADSDDSDEDDEDFEASNTSSGDSDMDDDEGDEKEDTDNKAEETSKPKHEADTQKKKGTQNSAAEINKKPDNRQLTELQQKNIERRDRRDSCTIIMYNIPEGTMVDEIKSSSPNITDVIFRNSSVKGKMNALVMCKSKDLAAKTCDRLREVQGVEVRPFQIKEQDPGFDPLNLRVIGLPSTTRILDIAKLFPKAGHIRLSRDFRTAYAAFLCKEDAEEAFNATENLHIQGLDVTVLFGRGGDAKGGFENISRQ